MNPGFREFIRMNSRNAVLDIKPWRLGSIPVVFDHMTVSLLFSVVSEHCPRFKCQCQVPYKFSHICNENVAG